MNEKPNRNQVFSIIYLVCAVICLIRGILSLMTQGNGVFVTRLLLAVIFFLFFLRYRRQE